MIADFLKAVLHYTASARTIEYHYHFHKTLYETCHNALLQVCCDLNSSTAIQERLSAQHRLECCVFCAVLGENFYG